MLVMVKNITTNRLTISKYSAISTNENIKVIGVTHTIIW